MAWRVRSPLRRRPSGAGSASGTGKAARLVEVGLLPFRGARAPVREEAAVVALRLPSVRRPATGDDDRQAA
jgi:hypothetical protein